MPPPSIEADSVLARAEDAIRRARRLTTAYSDLWAEEQRAAQEETRQPYSQPTPLASPLNGELGGGLSSQALPQHDQHLPTVTATPAAGAGNAVRGSDIDHLASAYSRSLIEAYLHGSASGSASGRSSQSPPLEQLPAVGRSGVLEAGLPRVTALLSALMRARLLQQEQGVGGTHEGSRLTSSVDHEPPQPASVQGDSPLTRSNQAQGGPRAWDYGGMVPREPLSMSRWAGASGSNSETEPQSWDGVTALTRDDDEPTRRGEVQDGVLAAGVAGEAEEGAVCGDKGIASGTGNDRQVDVDMEELEQEEDLQEDQMQPIFAVAQRLAALQRQQSDTLQQLLRLRLEQLRLRQQQLAALQCLLRTEAACIEGSPLQLSAVQQAVDLLTDSLDDVHAAAAALQWGGEITHAAAVAASVSEADSRAEEVSMMARQLLSALRRHPHRNSGGVSGPPPLRGATAEEIAQFPVEQCVEGSALQGETCSICLSTFQGGDDMRGLRCPSARTRHFFHKTCIDEWLGIRGCCPLCKYEIVVDESP